MYRQRLLPNPRSHFNPIVKAFIMSEAFLWSGWNFVIPITALYAATHVVGGNVTIAATGYSIYLTARVVFELISGRSLVRSSDQKKLIVAAIGVFLTSVSLFSFSFSTTIPTLFFSFAMGGMGFGIGAPAKNALFSIHMDKDQETTEWSIADGVTYICMALATALGGFIASQFGFKTLFLIAGIVCSLGIIPYLLSLVEEK